MRASHAHAIASPPASMLALAAAWHGATAASASQRVRVRLSCPAMATFHAHVHAVRMACLLHFLSFTGCGAHAKLAGVMPMMSVVQQTSICHRRRPQPPPQLWTWGCRWRKMRVPEASVCVQMLVDERPSQLRGCGAIMCGARVPRESVHFDRMCMHEGSSWWTLYGDDPEGLFQRLHGTARARDQHV